MRLEKLVNVAILFVCLLMSAHLGRDLYASRADRAPRSQVAARSGPSGISAPSAKEGDVIADNSELRLNTAKHTLIMVTASSCRFCTESMPFYQTITKIARDRQVRVLAATREDPRINETYLSLNGVKADGVVSSTDNQLSVPGTPTLLLVDSSGKVVRLWRGRLAKAGQDDVLKTLQSI